jgi:beta-glucosidase
MTPQRFPDDFLWGVATSAPQIEGAAREDGRGESVWDRYAARPGNIADGSRPDVTCDHYHRWREDLERLHWLGVGAYRFSTSWARVMPDGRGRPNPAGLDFYDRLTDGLLAAGIAPCVTLNHWDMPQVLQDRGGWPSRETVAAFAEYTDAVARRLGDRVRLWTTHNEPWCVATLGYEEGAHAPGLKDPAAALRAAHHLLVSHGHATGLIRQHAPGSEVGIVLNLSPGEPATDTEADREAARRFDGFFNRWYLDPLLRGEYPADAVADRIGRGHLASAELPFLQPDDLAVIATPLDYLGVNYYSRTVLRAGPQGEPEAVAPPADRRTEMGWEVYPAGLTDILERVHREYGPLPLHVTENGAAFVDPPVQGARIADPRRVQYLHDHLLAIARARDAGVPVAGYFAWSLLDNWEWAEGFTRRFGLFGVDFTSGERIPKDSAFWYRETIAAGTVVSTGPSLTSRRSP